jgi:predicted ATP-grasp superfamily ATP-dependent carboligase
LGQLPVALLTNTESDPAGGVPVVVLGESVTALGAVRCLGRRGIRALVPGPHRDYASWSRWARRLPGELVVEPDAGSLAHFLERLPVERAVVLPCSDGWTRAVAALPSLGGRFPSSVASPAAVEWFLDKGRFATLLEREGVPHPRSFVSSDHESLRGWSEASSSFFLKPIDSQAFMSRFGVKAVRVDDPRDAETTMMEAAREGLELMLQEYVPGPAAAHYFIDGYVARDGRTVARLARRRLRMYPPDFGNSTYHVTVPLEEVGDAAGTLEALLASVAYRGIFSAEYKRDDRDGELKLLEVNVRPWWYVEFAALCGVDVCRLAYREALGLPVDSVDAYEVDARCVLPGADVRAFLSLRARHELTLAGWLRSWVGASHAVFSPDDPLPIVRQLGEVAARRMRRRPATGSLRPARRGHP